MASLGLPPDRKITDNLHPLPRRVIPKPNIEPSDVDAQIGGLQYVGSYNWVDSPSPTIIVPGSPPRWLDREMPFTVPPDSSGIVFVDQNGYRMKSMPLLPLIKAVEFMPRTQGRSDRDVHWPSVDFVTDRSNLRKLMRWIDGYAGRAFRIDAQLAGNGTVLLSRWETRTREQGLPTSYGFNFEGASTTPAAGCEGTTSHHRIVKYNFGGLSMIVRFEVDAFIPPVASPVNDIDFPNRLEVPEPSTTSPLAAPSPLSLADQRNPLTILQGGAMVPQSSLIEVKSPSQKSATKRKWAEIYPQLYLSQTPWLYKAIHRDGQFYTVRKTQLGSSELADVAVKSKLRFQKLRLALQVIKNTIIESGAQGRLSLVLENRELVVFNRRSEASCLPKDIMALFQE
ncbi:hypothetical protein PILCRDRAFT_71145 [Piloderma croceum F 1598]|uniref:Geranylgeranyl pyrophosphate synthetase n=1 Tax=Piloderma croceum (strain F 1598) TaxID=765440 RepID=A0A0C3BY21_PILCF|nr:hypothetical protein PILCRDRAFT_71145 [Piloderma croceum F 1598]